MVCVWRSCLGRGSPTHFCIYFWRYRRSVPIGKKGGADMGQARMSQARTRDTDDLRSSNLAAWTLRSVEHTPSNFGRDPWPVRQGLVAAVKCSVRKTRNFCCPRAGCGTEKQKPEPCVGFNTTKADTCLFCVFRSHKCLPQGRVSVVIQNPFYVRTRYLAGTTWC